MVIYDAVSSLLQITKGLMWACIIPLFFKYAAVVTAVVAWISFFCCCFSWFCFCFVALVVFVVAIAVFVAVVVFVVLLFLPLLFFLILLLLFCCCCCFCYCCYCFCCCCFCCCCHWFCSYCLSLLFLFIHSRHKYPQRAQRSASQHYESRESVTHLVLTWLCFSPRSLTRPADGEDHISTCLRHRLCLLTHRPEPGSYSLTSVLLDKPQFPSRPFTRSSISTGTRTQFFLDLALHTTILGLSSIMWKKNRLSAFIYAFWWKPVPVHM